MRASSRSEGPARYLDVPMSMAGAPHLAVGTRLEVINPRNGKVAMVRINDRGAFVKGRDGST